MVLNYPNEWGGEDCLFILEKDDFVTQQDKDKLFIYNGNYNLSYSNCTFNDQEFRVISSLKNKIAYLFGTYGNDEEVAKVVEKIIPEITSVNLPACRSCQDSGLLRNAMKKFNFTLEDFLTNKKYVILSCCGRNFDTLDGIGLINWEKFAHYSFRGDQN